MRRAYVVLMVDVDRLLSFTPKQQTCSKPGSMRLMASPTFEAALYTYYMSWSVNNAASIRSVHA